jgi:large subunit ribosomal protein L33
MASKSREVIKLKSPESTSVYWTTKNKKTKTGRLELKKYDPLLRKHVVFKEAK